jgi:hypothetical protein
MIRGLRNGETPRLHPNGGGDESIGIPRSGLEGARRQAGTGNREADGCDCAHHEDDDLWHRPAHSERRRPASATRHDAGS